MRQRFDMRREDDGTWTVLDGMTGQQVVAAGLAMVGMSVDDADDMVDLLNRLDRDRQEMPKQ